MILQVHDELIFDVPKDEIEKVSELIKSKCKAKIRIIYLNISIIVHRNRIIQLISYKFKSQEGLF